MSRCIVCGGDGFQDAFHAYDRSVPRADTFLYRRCRACSLLALSPVPGPEEAKAFYPDDYGPHAGPHGALEGETDGGSAREGRPRDRRPWNRLALRTLFATSWAPGSRVRRVLAPAGRLLLRDLVLPRGGNRLLDVGCGAGSVLARHRALGWEVRGVEPSARGVAACRAAGLPVEQCDLLDAELPAERFDVVLLKHVVEHVRDPRAALARARSLLAPGGLLVVVTPNTAGIGLRAYGSCWYALDAPRHIHLFDATNLRRLAESVGLAVESIGVEGSTRVLAESRRLARAQGEHLPAGLAARRELLERAAPGRRDDRAFRRLAGPAVALLAAAGLGDTLRARFVRGAG